MMPVRRAGASIISGTTLDVASPPTTYNPDAQGERAKVEDEKFDQTMEEIAKRFGGGVLWRFDREVPRGYWWDRGMMYSDELAAVEVETVTVD
jgi:hypothetical protein